MEITITAPLSLDIGIHSKMKTKQQIEIWSTSPQRKEKRGKKRKERQGRKKDRQGVEETKRENKGKGRSSKKNFKM